MARKARKQEGEAKWERGTAKRIAEAKRREQEALKAAAEEMIARAILRAAQQRERETWNEIAETIRKGEERCN